MNSRRNVFQNNYDKGSNRLERRKNDNSSYTSCKTITMTHVRKDKSSGANNEGENERYTVSRIIKINDQLNMGRRDMKKKESFIYSTACIEYLK